MTGSAVAIASAFGSLLLARIPLVPKLVLVGSIVSMSLGAAVLHNGGLVNRVRGVDQATEIRVTVLRATTADSIVMTAIGEKLLWPDRQTFLISALAGTSESTGSFLSQIPDAGSLAAMASSLDAIGSEVFILDVVGWGSPEYLVGLDTALSSRGLRRDISVAGDSWVLYAVIAREAAG